MNMFEWLEHEILEIRDFGKMSGSHLSKTAKRIVFEQNPVLPGSKLPLLAIHKNISHVWEDGSRKVNNDEPDLRFFHGNF